MVKMRKTRIDIWSVSKMFKRPLGEAKVRAFESVQLYLGYKESKTC